MSTETVTPSVLSDARRAAARMELRALQLAAAVFGPLIAFVPLSKVPSVCVFFFITGLPCPGCGFTRGLQKAFWLNLPALLLLHPFALPGALWILLLIASIAVKPLANFYVERIRLVHKLYLAGTLAMLLFGLSRIIVILAYGGASWMAPELLGPGK